MKNWIFLIITFLSLNAFTQDVEIGQWRDYLPYQSGQFVEKMNGNIYLATENSIFYYRINDKSINRLSKTNGLTDVDISVMKKDEQNNRLIVAYQNANIDVITENNIDNISDIKRANIIGVKSINNIAFYEQDTYLSCSFGIVRLDINKAEVKDTYFLNKNQNLAINDLVFYNDSIFAATDSGIYKGKLGGNLNDYRKWHRSSIQQKVEEIELKENIIYYTQGSDSLFQLVNNQSNFVVEQEFLRKIKVIDQQLYVLSRSKLQKLNSINSLDLISESSFLYKSNDIIKDEENYWIADGSSSLISLTEQNNYQVFEPQGPDSDFVFSLSVSNNNLFVSPGGISITWNNNNTYKGFYWYDNYSWKKLNYNQLGSQEIRDITTILQGPNQSLFLASWNDGVIQLKCGQNGYEYDKTHNFFTTNGQIQTLNSEPSSSIYGRIRIKGLMFDENGNLWATNSLVEKSLARMNPQGQWQSYKIKSYNTITEHTGDLLIDDNNQKWFYIAKGGGLIVYNDNNTPELSNDDRDIHLTTAAGQGGLPSNLIFSLAKDREGQIWIGTDKGLAVFYNPENIFEEDIINAQQVLVESDGYVEPILNNESVTAIVIDGANRKWFGTQNSGLFLYNSDGSEQLYHFTESNSPLFSNNINSLAINQETGELFIGTSRGLISYRSGAIEGKKIHSDVLAYPNPVREDYNGPIAIKGLVRDANVKITDLNGHLVTEFTALGGQAVWDGKNGDGIRVSTGVYLVFTTNLNGTETNVAKILFIN
jgi:ligand-binding sensor domain-containing protein